MGVFILNRNIAEGNTTMETCTTLDWVRYTAPAKYRLTEMIPQEMAIDYDNRITPLPYYTHAMGIKDGGRIDWNVQNPTQGIMVTFTGDDLRSIECNIMSKEAIIKEMLEREYVKFTRIDLALDITNSGGKPGDLYHAFKSGEAVTRCKKARQIHGTKRDGSGDGDTTSFGDRAGETYLRVYDKGAQIAAKSGLAKKDKRNNKHELELLQTLENLDYIRAEVEVKSKRAELVAAMVAAQGTDRTTRTAIDRFIKFSSVAWWNDAIASLPTSEIDMLKGVNHSKEPSKTWLYTQALEAVLKAIRDEDKNVINAVTLELSNLYGGGFWTAE